ncbi:MAG: ADP-ribosylglycohydrolase family protein [Chloroflexota bacterium]
MSNHTQLTDRVMGCLLGGVIGDAMGAPTEGKTFAQIQEQFGWVDSFEGSGTDDSALRFILCEAIFAGGGWASVDNFAASFLKHKQRFYRLFYIPVRNMFHKIESELSLPVNAGIGNMHSSSSAMCISPMGIINAGDPRQAAREAFEVASLIHAGDSSFCRDGACAIAAAVAEAMNPASTVASILDAATAYLPPKSGREMLDCIQKVMDYLETEPSYEDFRQWHYDNCLGDIISDSRETVPCTLGLFLLAQGDPNVAIPMAANLGRDADTIATMLGGICGAFTGQSGINDAWVEKALEGEYSLVALGENLESVIKTRLEDRQQRMATIQSMLA